MSRTSFRTFAFALAIGSVFISGTPCESQAQIDISGQQAPPSPVILTIAALKQGVRLTWNNVDAPVVSEFIIYRLENYSPDTTLKSIATVPHNTATPKIVAYTDYSTQFGHTYTYFITSKTAFGVQSNNSKMVSVTTPTAANATIMSR